MLIINILCNKKEASVGLSFHHFVLYRCKVVVLVVELEKKVADT